MYKNLEMSILFKCTKLSTCSVLSPSPQGEGLGREIKILTYPPHSSPLLEERGLLPAT